jgi:hypothetical protein
MKYKLIDTEDELSNDGAEILTLEKTMEEIKQWNEDMDTDYKSIQDFNEGEEYYQIIEIK